MSLCIFHSDVVSYELLNLAPVHYETFMKTYGAGNTFQMSTQTGDSLDEEIQTEPIEVTDKEIQFPPSLSMLTAGPKAVSSFTTGDTSLEKGFGSGTAGSSVRLSKFLKWASHAMITLVEEDSKHSGINDVDRGDEKKNADKLAFSDHVTTLDTNKYTFLKGRPVTKIEFAPDQPDVFVTAHGFPNYSGGFDNQSNEETGEEISEIGEYCFLCVWNINYPSIIQKGKMCLKAPVNININIKWQRSYFWLKLLVQL